MRYILGLSCILGLLGAAHGQVSVDISGGGVAVNVGRGNVASNTAGSLGSSVEMQGVAVINGEVWIDGVKVPKGQKSYYSKASAKTYEIAWGKNGEVAVREK